MSEQATGPMIRLRSVLGEKGSVVLFTLFVCLATALCIQVLSVVLICGERALAEERRGRELAGDRDEGIATLRSLALVAWGRQGWMEVCAGAGETVGRLEDLEGGEGWLLDAEVVQDEAVAGLGVSAWVERGRDGIDLPLSPLVAGRVFWDPERVVAWLTAGSTGGPGMASVCSEVEAVGYVTLMPEHPHLGVGCSLAQMGRAWELDAGWRALTDGDCLMGSRMYLLAGMNGERLAMPGSIPVTSVDHPVLVVVTGGADLDCRGIGDLHGVVVVDGGSVFLEGTIVHGAVIVSGDVHFGLTGQVELSASVLRWATDRSLERVRVVPGTRYESTE
jgi:hypothetical protein